MGGSRDDEMLYKDSRGTDKTIQLYCGMYHNLTTGETDENMHTVFHDEISWAMDRGRH